MPAIKSSADLRNNYNEISTFCHNYPEPVFITNGISIDSITKLYTNFVMESMDIPLVLAG